MKYPRHLAIILALGLVGCATAPGGEGGSTRDPRTITVEEIRSSGHSNAHDLVQALRPAWLRIRGQTTLRPGGDPILVYIENQRLGTLEQLQNVSAANIDSMRFLDRREATLQFGSGHVNGAIVIRTRGGAERSREGESGPQGTRPGEGS